MSYKKDVLVDVDFYRQNKDNPTYKFIEVNGDNTLFEQSHPSGTFSLDWVTQLNDPVRRTIIGRDALAEKLSKLGVTTESKIILYGDNGNWFAAFAYWIFKLYGHEKVKILDGGRKLLQTSKIDFVSDIQQAEKTNYTYPTSGNPDLRAKRSEVLENLGKVDLVDVRSPDEYTGKVIAPPGMDETAQRGGHIPTAINQPWSGVINDDGTFKSYEDLSKIYNDKGVSGDRPVIAYCRIGERSSHTWFVLRELLGYENVKNYDGSWTEYGNLIDVPIAKGEEPGIIDN